MKTFLSTFILTFVLLSASTLAASVQPRLAARVDRRYEEHYYHVSAQAIRSHCQRAGHVTVCQVAVCARWFEGGPRLWATGLRDVVWEDRGKIYVRYVPANVTIKYLC